MGMMGALLGAAGGSSGGTTSGTVSTASGTVSITPDPRLNALYVQATYRDHDTIRQLLQIIDVEAGPDAIQIQSRPRFIPVMHGKADEVATIIRQVYSGRLADTGGGGQRGGGGGSPQELFLQMALGGRGGGRGGGGNRNQANRGEEQKMTMGVDLKSNSLIVSAPDYLFSEIAELVRTLDVAAVPPDQTVRVASLKRVNGDALKSSLSSMLGTNATINRTSSLTTTTTAAPPRTGAAGTTTAQGKATPAMQAARTKAITPASGKWPSSSIRAAAAGSQVERIWRRLPWRWKLWWPRRRWRRLPRWR